MLMPVNVFFVERRSFWGKKLNQKDLPTALCFDKNITKQIDDLYQQSGSITNGDFFLLRENIRNSQ